MMAGRGIEEALATLGGKHDLYDRIFHTGQIPVRVTSAIDKASPSSYVVIVFHETPVFASSPWPLERCGPGQSADSLCVLHPQLVQLSWTQRANRPDAMRLHFCALEVLVAVEQRFADERLRPDGLTRVKALLRRAAALDPDRVPQEDLEDTVCACINCLHLLSTVGECPLLAKEQLQMIYSKVRGGLCIVLRP
jgi:hypothetical protein